MTHMDKHKAVFLLLMMRLSAVEGHRTRQLQKTGKEQNIPNFKIKIMLLKGQRSGFAPLDPANR